MPVVGIISEYNPLHLGHQKQYRLIRQRLGQDTAIVCIMSGNYVQRGAPALFDKSIRAEAAIAAGADLVLELPVTAALSSAEGFAREGVRFLSPICDVLSFGCEAGEKNYLLESAAALRSEAFSHHLRNLLDTGISFPAARQKALEALGIPVLTGPNDTLALEYCKAILELGSSMDILPVRREGDYHSRQPDVENPSASSLRLLAEKNEDFSAYLPTECAALFTEAPRHCLEYGERAMLARLRCMAEDDFAALPYGSEGLWRKLWKNCRDCSSISEILEATKSKRYTRSRLDRMLMCAFLGLSTADMAAPAPYARALAMNNRGRQLLKQARQQGLYPNPGEFPDEYYGNLEKRCGSLYGLFAEGLPDAPDLEEKRRMIYLQNP